MKPVPSSTVGTIVAALNQGMSTREVAKQARVSQSTVCNVKRMRLPEQPAKQAGRPRSLSPRQKRLVVRMVTSGHVDTAVQMQRCLREAEDTAVSADTVRNCLKE